MGGNCCSLVHGSARIYIPRHAAACRRTHMASFSLANMLAGQVPWQVTNGHPLADPESFRSSQQVVVRQSEQWLAARGGNRWSLVDSSARRELRPAAIFPKSGGDRFRREALGPRPRRCVSSARPGKRSTAAGSKAPASADRSSRSGPARPAQARVDLGPALLGLVQTRGPVSPNRREVQTPCTTTSVDSPRH